MKELYRLLPHAFRRRGVFVVFTLLLRAMLNFMGLAMLLPVLALLLHPESLSGDNLLARIYTFSGIASPRGFAYAVCGTIILVILLKCLLNIVLVGVERRYVFALYRTLSRRLYVVYHSRGLQFIKRSGATKLTRNVNFICLRFTTGVLQPATAIIAETMLIVLLFVALAVWMPYAALLVAVVFVPTAVIYHLLIRRRTERYGEREEMAQRQKARSVAETFRGFADIELNNAFPQALYTFDHSMDTIIRNRSKEANAAQLPGILTETGVAAGLALLAALSFEERFEDIQLLFGIFAVVALRLMPSIRKILTGLATIRYNRHTIGILQEAITDGPAPTTSPTDSIVFEHEISGHNLGFRFSDGTDDLFHHFSFCIRKGERIGLRGTSGVGKTTLLNLLLGFYEPTEGEIRIDGTPLSAQNRRAWQNRIGYVSQQLFLSDGTIAENIALGVPENKIDRLRVADVIRAAQLDTLVATLPAGADTPIGESGCRLSGGQRQRIGIARALYRHADVLLFDEATSALDDDTEREIKQAVTLLTRQQPNLTILIAAHRESSLEGCDRILTLQNGQNI